ncbi:MAG: hypothetical protein ACOCQR_00240 [bacterium]
MEQWIKEAMKTKTTEEFLYKLALRGYYLALNEGKGFTCSYIGNEKKVKRKELALVELMLKRRKEKIVFHFNTTKELYIDLRTTEEYISQKYEPRPELKEDTLLWQCILKKAYNKNSKLYLTLYWLRTGGAKLTYNEEKKKIRIQARYGTKFQWKNKEEWRQDFKSWIYPRKKEMGLLFQEALKETLLKLEKDVCLRTTHH